MPDLDGPNQEMWADLRSVRPQNSNEFATLPVLLAGNPTGILMAMSANGRPRLLVPVDAAGPEHSPFKITLRGLTIIEVRLNLGGVSRLMLDASSEPAEEAMFTVVAKELAWDVAVQGRAARKAAVNMVKRWKAYWSAPSKPMTLEAQLGLYAEVYVLRRILIPRLGPSAVMTWKGPIGERHDFQGNSWHIEAKATFKAAPIFRIHGHDQLAVTEGWQLLLCAMQASQESSSEEGLDREIDLSREVLRASPVEAALFEECLHALDYAPTEDSLRLRIRRADFYLVDENFPKIEVQRASDAVVGIDWDFDLSSFPACEKNAWESVIA